MRDWYSPAHTNPSGGTPFRPGSRTRKLAGTYQHRRCYHSRLPSTLLRSAGGRRARCGAAGGTAPGRAAATTRAGADRPPAIVAAQIGTSLSSRVPADGLPATCCSRPPSRSREPSPVARAVAAMTSLDRLHAVPRWRIVRAGAAMAGPVARAWPMIRQAGAMAEKLTLMAVHAHPDDESSSTGGVLAKYSAEGIRTVVVTCTNGEFGDAPGQVKPGDDGHDTDSVAKIRLAELDVACKHLGVSDLDVLGYHDSGMPEWDYKDQPDVFSNVPLATITDQIAGLIDRYRPQVVVTYDDNGGYQHPDHLHASRAAVAAVSATGIPSKLYLIAMRTSGWQEVWEALRDQGVDVPDFNDIDPDMRRMMDEAERRITTTVDIRPVLERKGEALRAHASQMEESWFSKMPPEVAARAFGYETFIRASDSTGTPVPEDDLFAGLR